MAARRGRSGDARRFPPPWADPPSQAAFEVEWAAEHNRIVRHACIPALIVSIACLGLLIWHGPFEATSSSVVYAALLLSAVLSASLLVRPLLVEAGQRRLLKPAAKLTLWTIDRTRGRWARIDGRAVLPGTPREALDRAGDRAGDIPTAARIRALIWAGDLDAAGRGLAGWRPTSLEGVARKALFAAEVEHGSTGVWDGAAARAAVEAIADPAQRAEAGAWLGLEEARRLAERGEPMLPAVRKLSLELEPIAYSHLRPDEALPSIRRTLVLDALAVALVWSGAILAPNDFILPLCAMTLVPLTAFVELVISARLWRARNSVPVATAAPLTRPFFGQPMVPADDPPLLRMFWQERQRLDRGGALVVLLVLAVFVLIAFGALASAEQSAVSFGAGTGLLLLIFLPPVFVTRARLIAGKRFVPAAELCCFAYDLERRQWRSIDGEAELPASVEEALARIGTGQGDVAAFWRVRALAEEGRVAEADAALKRWRPAGPAAEVARARLRAWLHEWFLIGKDAPDYDALNAQAAGLADPEARLAEAAFLALDEARFAARRGDPALDLLAGRRRAMGRLSYETLRDLDNPEQLALRARLGETGVWLVAVVAAIAVMLAVWASPLPS
jgi:hypothetical protein